jgi:hypothetical protein
MTPPSINQRNQSIIAGNQFAFLGVSLVIAVYRQAVPKAIYPTGTYFVPYLAFFAANPHRETIRSRSGPIIKFQELSLDSYVAHETATTNEQTPSHTLPNSNLSSTATT